MVDARSPATVPCAVGPPPSVAIATETPSVAERRVPRPRPRPGRSASTRASDRDGELERGQFVRGRVHHGGGVGGRDGRQAGGAGVQGDQVVMHRHERVVGHGRRHGGVVSTPRRRQQVTLDGMAHELVTEDEAIGRLDDEAVFDPLLESGREVRIEDPVAPPRSRGRARGPTGRLELEGLRDRGH